MVIIFYLIFLKKIFEGNIGILSVRPELVEGLLASILDNAIIPTRMTAKDGGAATVPYG